MDRTTLDGLVDRPHEDSMLGFGSRVVAAGDGGLESPKVGLDRRRVAPILQALTLGTEDSLLL